MGYLVVCIIGDKSHVKRGITTQVLKHRWHMSVWVKDWLIAIAFAISLAIVHLHHEVAKTSLIEKDFKVVTGASVVVIGLTGGSLGSCHGETVQNVYSCNNDRIEVYLLSPFGVLSI